MLSMEVRLEFSIYCLEGLDDGGHFIVVFTLLLCVLMLVSNKVSFYFDQYYLILSSLV